MGVVEIWIPCPHRKGNLGSAESSPYKNMPRPLTKSVSTEGRSCVLVTRKRKLLLVRRRKMKYGEDNGK